MLIESFVDKRVVENLPVKDFEALALGGFVVSWLWLAQHNLSHKENLSYTPLLTAYLSKVQPRRMLEWGPGYSTLLMMQEAPQAEIYTVEHDPRWYDYWQPQLTTVNLSYIPLGEYATAPLTWGLFDLIFVDGRNRVECLKTARKILAPNGVVILHDSQRERYREGKHLFRIVEESDRTAVMQ